MFALVDCNNFYASCERVFRPDLNGKPLVVLSNNDGCVIARSNEAKSLNIPMGAPAFKFKSVFKKHRIQVFSSNYALYADMSSRVMQGLSEFTPGVEIYSIDEAFLSFKGFENYDLEEYGRQIRRKVSKGTGIPLSVGIAPTKALAKLSNRIAKKFPERTQHVYFINSDKQRIKALKWLKIQDVWGIGRKHSERLHKIGVNNAFQFTQLPDAWVKKNMSIVGLRLKRELEGKSVLELEEQKNKKNIAVTRSFEKMYSDYEQIKERVVTFAVTVAEKLRRQNSVCNALMIFLHTNGFRKELPQYARNIIIDFPYASNSGPELAKFALAGLERIYKKGYRYKKAGVIALEIVPESPRQLTLFGGADPRLRKLMKAADDINDAYGQGTVKLAAQNLKKTWKMRQEKLSPHYSTRLSDIIKVNA